MKVSSQAILSRTHSRMPGKAATPFFSAGFTLIETLVALTLVISAMVGPFSLATRSIYSAKFAKSKLIALNLSQEGLEIIRQMRDNNVLGGYNWRGLQGSCPLGCTILQDGSYQIDVFTAANGSTPPVNANTPLSFSALTSLYSYQSGGQATPFIRVITLSTPAADEMDVVSVVSWSDAGIARQVRLEEILYNWQ